MATFDMRGIATTLKKPRNRFEFQLDAELKNVALGDIIKILDVCPAQRVTAVHLTVLEAEGAACTANIGDGVNASLYFAASDMNALSHSVSATTKYYTVEDTLKITFLAAASKVRLAVQFEVEDFVAEDIKVFGGTAK